MNKGMILILCVIVVVGPVCLHTQALSPLQNGTPDGSSVLTPYKNGLRYQSISAGSESITIAYTDTKQGAKTLLFIHGLASNLPVWEQLIEELSPVYRCVAIDLPGYGRSSSSSTVSLLLYARYLKTFADSLQLTNVSIIGHSLGGQIAVFMALQNPSFVQNLILLAPSGFENFSKRDKEFIKMFYTPQFLKAKTDDIIKSDYERGFFTFPEYAGFLIKDRIAIKHTAEFHNYCLVNARCVQSAVKETILDKLAGLQSATLIMFGEEDNMIPSSLLHPHLTTKTIAEFAQKKIKRSSLVLIPECGHFVQMEKTTLVKKAIVEFIK